MGILWYRMVRRHQLACFLYYSLNCNHTYLNCIHIHSDSGWRLKQPKTIVAGTLTHIDLLIF